MPFFVASRSYFLVITKILSISLAGLLQIWHTASDIWALHVFRKIVSHCALPPKGVLNRIQTCYKTTTVLLRGSPPCYQLTLTGHATSILRAAHTGFADALLQTLAWYLSRSGSTLTSSTMTVSVDVGPERNLKRCSCLPSACTHCGASYSCMSLTYPAHCVRENRQIWVGRRA